MSRGREVEGKKQGEKEKGKRKGKGCVNREKQTNKQKALTSTQRSPMQVLSPERKPLREPEPYSISNLVPLGK